MSCVYNRKFLKSTLARSSNHGDFDALYLELSAVCLNLSNLRSGECPEVSSEVNACTLS